jgi:glutamate dehydrogenase
VRASGETDADAGDRANDPLRVSAAEVKASVIGEGANLGMTQRGRIEFAARGGRINTDFIDNSAGVNTSDQEVNIKIALNAATRSGRLGVPARNKLLGEMTDDVAAASLRNNYQQSLALSLAERRSAHELSSYALLMRALEGHGLLDRALEALPSDQELQERTRAGRGLTRPELAVLLSYAKIALQDDLLRSKVPDEPQVQAWLAQYFPPALRDKFSADIEKHSLRREIIALGLTNAIVNRGGPPMAVLLADETRHTTAEVAHAFLAAREVFELPALWQRIDALDGLAKGEAQLALYQATQDLIVAQTLWFLRDGAALADLVGTIVRHKAGIAALRPALGTVLPPRYRSALDQEVARLGVGGVPSDLATDVAELTLLSLAPAITQISEVTGTPVADVAGFYLAIGDHLRLADLAAKADTIPTPDYYDRLAVTQARAQLESALSVFTRDAIGDGADDVQDWLAEQGDRLVRVRATLQEIATEGALTVSRLLVAAGQLADVAAAGLAAPSPSPRKARKGHPARSAASGSPPARKPARRSRS